MHYELYELRLAAKVLRVTNRTRCNIPALRLSHIQGVDLRRLSGTPLRMHDSIIIPSDEGSCCRVGEDD